LLRNTRRLFLAFPGREFYSRARTLLGDLRDAQDAVNASMLNSMGTLRISASLSFSMQSIAPPLRACTERYPNVHVHVQAANRYPDIIDDNIDVAIRNRGQRRPDPAGSGARRHRYSCAARLHRL
jgi:DNA-binding transcriptional LysR family regulator